MKNAVLHTLFVCALAFVATTANEAQIVVEEADGKWEPTLVQEPKEGDFGPIETRVIAAEAKAIYRDILEAMPPDALPPTGSKMLIVTAKGTLHIPLAVPSGLDRPLPLRVILANANGTYIQPLIPMNPAIVNFTADAKSSSVDLTWTKRRPEEFPNALIVYSQERISWQPGDGKDYAVGSIIEEKVVVSFAGETDYSETPLTVPNLTSGVTYHFAAFPFDSEKNYSIAAYASAQMSTPSSTKGTFTISLKERLNFISLPVNPDTLYTARRLAEETAATLVLRFDADNQEFVSYISGFDPGEGFPLVGGEGYIVNVETPQEITFEGQVWSNAPPAQTSFDGTVWAFAVAGQIAAQSPADVFLRVTVTNPRTGWQRDQTLPPAGGVFTIAVADMSRRAVVALGDTLDIQITDAEDHLLHATEVHVTDTQLRKARLILPTLTVRTSPTESKLLQNFPNPFNPETWIPYNLAEASEVTIRIYDTRGREVRTFELGYQPAGWYDTRATAAHWDGSNVQGERVSSGVYWAVLKAGTFRATKRLVVRK